MSHPDSDALAAAALGEALAAADAAHLADCPACRSTVAELARARQLAMAARDSESWEAPPPGVLAAVLAEIERPATPAVTPEQTGSAGGPPDADVTVLHPGPRPSRRSALGWLVGVAAGGAVIGWVGGRALGPRPAPEPSPTALATVALRTLDTDQQRGVATVLQAGSATELEVTTDDLGSTPGYFEVWLINTDGKRMVSVGVLDGPSATFPISAELLAAGYRIVDVTREQLDDKPTHSGDSVVRGTLPL